MATPTLSNGATLTPGRFMALDRDDLSVLDEDGVPIFSGNQVDVQRFLDARDLIPYCNCELVEAISQHCVSFQ